MKMKRKKLSVKRMYFICQQLSFALESGMSLPMALQLAAGELRHHASRQFLIDLHDAMEHGMLASEALVTGSVSCPAVFQEFVLAGEQNGAMQEALSQAAEYFQQQNKTKQMLFSALCYPVILLLLMVAAFGAMLMFVVPAVVSTYHNVQAELPQFTQFLLLAGQWLNRYWMVVCGVIVCSVPILYCFLGQALKKSFIRNGVKELVLRVPLIGVMYQQYWFVQIAQGLGLMLSSGMLLVNALQAVTQIYKRSLFSDELAQLKNSIAAGHLWADGIQSCSFIPELARQMLVISEQSGTLPKALAQLQQYYRQQFQQKIQVLMSVLEPCMIILLGLGILAIAGSLFLPLVQSYQHLL